MAVSNLNLGPGFAAALLAKKRRDLAAAQAEAAGQLRQSDIGRQFYQAGQNLESNLEGRGILKSGEAMTGRVNLGAEEKAARAAATMQTENAINQANMDYASALAAAQAASSQGTAAQPAAPAPRPSRPGGGGNSGDDGSSNAPKGPTLPPGIDFGALANAMNKPKTVTPTPVRTVGGITVRPGDTPSETTGRGTRKPVTRPSTPTNQFGRIRGGM